MMFIACSLQGFYWLYVMFPAYQRCPHMATCSELIGLNWLTEQGSYDYIVICEYLFNPHYRTGGI